MKIKMMTKEQIIKLKRLNTDIAAGRRGLPKKAEHKIYEEESLETKLEKRTIKELKDYAKNQGLKIKGNNKKDIINEILNEIRIKLKEVKK